MALLAIDDLDMAIGNHVILEGIHMSLERSDIVTIVGPNGSGKSTLVRCIIGALTPSRGSVTRAPDLTIGYVPQRLAIDATLPMPVSRFLSLPKRHTAQQRQQALSQAGIGHCSNQAMAELSGGQFQRVLLARALLDRPDLLILDEASQGLDHQGTVAFYQRIGALRRELGCAVLMISHDLHVVMRTSDQVICLNRTIQCQGKPETVASSPAYQALFGQDAQGVLALYRHDHSHDASTTKESLS